MPSFQLGSTESLPGQRTYHRLGRRVPRATQPLISVIIPCFNQGRFLDDAINSVLAQQYERTEIFVIDDGSADETASVSRAFPSARYIRQPHGGRSRARNHGLQLVAGEFVVFLDADDRLLPNHFSASLRALTAAPDAAFVFGDFRNLGAPTQHRHRCNPTPDYYGTFLRCRDEALGALHSAMFRRDAVVAVGGFPERLEAAEDIDLFLRLAWRFRVVCHHEVVAEYRKHEAQTTEHYDVMLAGITRVYRAHRFRGWLPRYRTAYRSGRRLIHEATAIPLSWQFVAALHDGRYGIAARYGWALLRYAPSTFLTIGLAKLRKTIARWQTDQRAAGSQ